MRKFAGVKFQKRQSFHFPSLSIINTGLTGIVFRVRNASLSSKEKFIIIFRKN